MELYFPVWLTAAPLRSRGRGRRRRRKKKWGGSSHRSLTWTALLEKGSDVTDTSLLFVFATPISSVTGACGETRQSITVPSLHPSLPVSLSHSIPSLAFFLFILFLTTFSNPPPPTIHSYLVWLVIVSSYSLLSSPLPPYPSPLSVSLQHARVTEGEERGNMSFKTVRHLPALISDTPRKNCSGA